MREEQLELSELHDHTVGENYQLKIENEDLRDRLSLITQDEGYTIDYQAYLPVLDFENIINHCRNLEELTSAKSLILTYIFSLKKENRNLIKRLNNREVSKKSSMGPRKHSQLPYQQPQDLMNMSVKSVIAPRRAD